MRGSRVKKLRKIYRIWVGTIMDQIPDGYAPISFRVFRRRVTDEVSKVYRLRQGRNQRGIALPQA